MLSEGILTRSPRVFVDSTLDVEMHYADFADC